MPINRTKKDENDVMMAKMCDGWNQFSAVII